MKPKKNKRTFKDDPIVAILREHGSRAVHVGEIRAQLRAPRAEHELVAAHLSKLVSQGAVTELPGGKYRLRKEPVAAPSRDDAGSPRASTGRARGKQDIRSGRLGVHSRGFGFVVLDETGPDVFVPPQALGSALHGDRVSVRVRPSPKGLDGQVVEILERSMHFVGGQLHVMPVGAFIEPDDDRLKATVRVTGKLPSGARTGQGVIAKIVGYPEVPGDPLLARIVETFEAAEFAEFEIRRILLSQGVREDFPEDVVAEAKAFPDHVTAQDRQGREDFRKLDLVTIDPEDARDHDDAVFAERLKDGYRVVVAIADVSYYVREGTAIDREALSRGCTIYLPNRAIPMLPRELSSELASLIEHQDRLALAVDIELDLSGTVRKYRFVECVMRCAAGLTYEGVARALGITDAVPPQPDAEARKPLLSALLDLAKLLGAKRKSRGSLDFDLPEAKVKLNTETGEPASIERSRRDPGIRAAYNLVEEMMLLANEVVAADLTAREVAAIYRVHGAPNEEKVVAFADLARSLGFDLDEDVVENPIKLSHFLASASATPHAELLSYLLLRAMQQATYTTENIGHFGLAAPDYVHFTSPIRRYPDLAVHRTVRKIARGEAIRGKHLHEALSSQATESSRLERRAMLMEREVVDLYRAMLMRERVGETFEATITGITENGIFAALDSPYVDVYVRTTALFPDQYEIDRYGTRLFGIRSGQSYALFDRIKVRIEDVSIARRRISALPALTDDEAAEQQDGDAADAVDALAVRPQRTPALQPGARSNDRKLAGAPKRNVSNKRGTTDTRSTRGRDAKRGAKPDNAAGRRAKRPRKR